MQPTFREMLYQLKPLAGTILTLPMPEIAEICADAGFDWLFLDMEHGLIDIPAVQRIAQAVDYRCPCVPRLPANDEYWIKKVLDTGVSALILPMVNTADDAARAVRHSKYPPLGGRSVGAARAHRYGPGFADYVATANQKIAVLVQVEHIEAVNNLEKILQVEGLDGIFIGPFDLSGSMGKPGQVEDPEVVQAVEHVRQVCQARRIPLGIFVPDAAKARQSVEQGYTFPAVSSDVILFAEAVRKLVQSMKG